MDLVEKLPSMTDVELQNLRNNVDKIVLAGKAKHSQEAARLLPLIQSEQELRASRKPAPRKAAVRKKAVAAPAAAKTAD